MSEYTETQQRIVMVLDRIKQQVLDNEDDAEIWAEELEMLLNDLHGNDFFGTEGQIDPRGDFREGDWSLLSNVEGVDE